MSDVVRITVNLPRSLLCELDGLGGTRDEAIRRAVEYYLAERRHRLRESLRRGYAEMAELNLSLAEELGVLPLPETRLAEGE